LAKWGIKLYIFYSYILKLSNGNYYIGYSSNLKSRLKEHENGRVFAKKKFRPLKLNFYAAFTTRQKATDFEKYLKTNQVLLSETNV
jgi:putative endonuclease